MLYPIIEVDTTVPPADIFQLCDLDSSATYFVSVRALCDTSKKSTDWTEPIYFRLTNPQNGIEAPESALGRHTFLAPNPARDHVSVSSHFLVAQVDAYDAHGTLVYSEPTFDVNADINISSWPKGSYVFIVHTHHGSTAKVPRQRIAGHFHLPSSGCLSHRGISSSIPRSRRNPYTIQR